MQIWTFLHILSMFAAVTVALGAQLWVTYAIRNRDLGALGAYFRVQSRADNVSGLLLGVGVIFGLVAAITIGFNLMQGWLIIAYVLVVATLIVGGAMTPYLKRLKAALDESDGDDPGPEMAALLDSRMPIVAMAATTIFIGAIIWDMVFKPQF
jgi:uncharacterized membrane protein